MVKQVKIILDNEDFKELEKLKIKAGLTWDRFFLLPLKKVKI